MTQADDVSAKNPPGEPAPTDKILQEGEVKASRAGEVAAARTKPQPEPTAEGDTPAPRAKPEPKPEKPLADYLKEDLAPLLEKSMKQAGAADTRITTAESELSAVWENADKTFTLYFDEGTLDGRKTISYAQAHSRGRVVQMFMPPERAFKGIDAKQITAMILSQFTTTLTWIKPGSKVG
ncbi:MAG: DUF2996 domain-containing protein [Gemmatimonadaceae bacterium]|nr:DUF2996 domain-containing protein [Gloeobacterales cyanobacterium ES-bin-141]